MSPCAKNTLKTSRHCSPSGLEFETCAVWDTSILNYCYFSWLNHLSDSYEIGTVTECLSLLITFEVNQQCNMV
uniref:Uncharacterized protein n=1 Tax=Anguilla anguilla TaxID=7936 RepID=A0A0E9UMZ0_ANGAN